MAAGFCAGWFVVNVLPASYIVVDLAVGGSIYLAIVLALGYVVREDAVHGVLLARMHRSGGAEAGDGEA